FKEEYYTVLEIKDNGKGFDLQKCGHALFKPFSKTSVNQNGMGTGLYLVKTIIEKNGGHVEIDSTPKEGTVVRLYLKPTVHIS
ncbi:MAG: ATP-binding protein, partial [Saprospiraceae bacterium]